MFNIFTQLIVVLYVLDNDTNTMVAISVCIGLVIEAWKITKVMDISVRCCVLPSRFCVFVAQAVFSKLGSLEIKMWGPKTFIFQLFNY